MGQTINSDVFDFQIFGNDPAKKISKIELMGGGPNNRGGKPDLIRRFVIDQNQVLINYTYRVSNQAPPKNDPNYYRFYYLYFYQRNSINYHELKGVTAPIFSNYSPP